jgi:hypothetical protein
MSDLDTRILAYMRGLPALTVSEIAATVVPTGSRRVAAALVLSALRRLASAGLVRGAESTVGSRYPMEWAVR